MEKHVKVTLEAFGDRSVTAMLTRDEVENKTFKEVVETMVQKNYSGEDAQALTMIKTQMNASGGFSTQAGVGFPNRFEPVRLNETVAKYIQKTPGIGQQETLRTTVLAQHVVGLEYQI